jgi:7-cyano-7-deazaguanine reductase
MASAGTLGVALAGGSGRRGAPAAGQQRQRRHQHRHRRPRSEAHHGYTLKCMPTRPSKRLDVFPNAHPGRDYEVELTCPEFTCVCPMTGQPDFATFTITYVPDERCVELKSLKLYLWSFRDEGHFHEDVTNIVLNDLVNALDPRRIRVVGDFNVRGGIHTVVRASHQK